MSDEDPRWFKVFDIDLGIDVTDCWDLDEDWCRDIFKYGCLVYWAINEDAELVLMDSCGHMEYAPEKYQFRALRIPTQQWL